MASIASHSTTTEHSRRFHHRSKSDGGFFVLLLQRALKFPQMDLDYAAATVAELVWSPSKVYKLAQSRHEIKGHWSRDDPAFILILCFFVVVDFVAYGFALDTERSLGKTIRHVLIGLFFFFFLGSVIATTTWFIANKYFQARHPHSSHQKVEWFYAFDIHCNSFLPAFMLLCVIQYLLLPLFLRGGILPTLLSKTLHLAASLIYVHVTVLGYLHLPFLNRDKVTVMWNPAFLLVLLWFLFSILNINCSHLFLYRLF
jgi:hypothetical protein